MKQIDPIISIIGMIVVSAIIGIFSNSTIGIVVFGTLYSIGLIGDKIMGKIPTTHD